MATSRTDVEAVVEFFDPNNKTKSDKSGRNYPQYGFLFVIDDGTRIPIQDEGLDAAISPQLRRDNIFTVDIVADPTNPTRDKVKATNFRFVRTEAGAADSAKAKFKPAKSGAPTPSSTKADKADPKQNTEELWRLEVMGEPVGGDNSGEWTISVELDKNNYPVPDAKIKFRAGSTSFVGTTGPEGCIEQTITVSDNTYGRVVYDSSLSISGIPIAGPDKAVAPKRKLTGWHWFNNFLYGFWTAVLVLSIILWVRAGYVELTTPYSQTKSVSTTQQDNGRPKFSWDKTQQPAPETEQAAVSWGGYIWSWTPMGSFLILLLWFFLWIILFPICFGAEIWEALLNQYQKSKGAIEAWRHTREPFQYTVEVIRNGGKIAQKPVYMYNGEKVNKPETRSEAMSSLKNMKFGDIKEFIKFDLLSDLGVMLFDRFVLGRLFGGR